MEAHKEELWEGEAEAVVKALTGGDREVEVEVKIEAQARVSEVHCRPSAIMGHI